MVWRQLSINEAEAHPLYGVRGWLLLVLSLFVLGGIVAVLELVLPTPAGFASLFGRYAREVAWVDGTAALFLALVALLGFARSPLFGALVVPALVLRFLGVGLVSATFAIDAVSAEGAAHLAGSGVVLGGIIVAVAVCAVFCGLLTWYFLASARVNVTYRHRVRAGLLDIPTVPDPWRRVRDV